MMSKYKQKPLEKPRKKSSNSTLSEPRVGMSIQATIVRHIDGLGSLKDYCIRDLVNHAEQFGSFLNNKKLKTSQVRKFLDAINQLKTEMTKDNDFKRIETGVVLLKPKLAYAAARQESAKPLSEVMSKAIDKVETTEDFERLVQFIESIIAYHKAAGGKDI